MHSYFYSFVVGSRTHFQILSRTSGSRRQDEAEPWKGSQSYCCCGMRWRKDRHQSRKLKAQCGSSAFEEPHKHTHTHKAANERWFQAGVLYCGQNQIPELRSPSLRNASYPRWTLGIVTLPVLRLFKASMSSTELSPSCSHVWPLLLIISRQLEF